MGITIHYKAKVKENVIGKISDYIDKFAHKTKRPSGVLSKADKTRELDMFNAIYSYKYGKASDVKGRWIHPYDGVEDVRMNFFKTPKGWIMDSFTKTQYGGIAGHLVTCKIIEDVKNKYIKDLKINDEAEYCGKKVRSFDKLRDNFEESAIIIDKVGEMLTKAGFDKTDIITGGELAIGEQKRKRLRKVV